MIKPNEITISSIVVILYDASRTLLEALAVMKGYKIYNHECYFAFLKEIISNEKMAYLFNKLRLIRNGINYYGEPILLIEGNIALKELNNLILFLKNELRINMDK
jgi:hypothetical protein